MSTNTSQRQDQRQEYKITLIPEAARRCNQFVSKLRNRFIFQLNLGTVFNAMVITGKFDERAIAIKINDTFLAAPTNQASNQWRGIMVRPAYEVCNEQQKALKKYFLYQPDIYMVVNAMLLTGEFDINKICEHIRQAFSFNQPASVPPAIQKETVSLATK